MNPTKTNRIAGTALVMALVCLLISLVWPDQGDSAQQRSSRKSTKKPKAADTVAVVKKAPEIPLPPPPTFAQIDQWETRSARIAITDAPVGHIARSVERLCRYFGIGFDITSPLLSSLSPHEWPMVFAEQRPNSKRQRIEIEKLLHRNSLRFETLSTAEPKDLSDVMARAVAGGAPVLLNAPAAPIIYGYDRREADPWWLVQWREQREIVYESERIRTLVWWTDDPTANLGWAIHGPDSSFLSSKMQVDDYGWLRTVTASVTGNEKEGVTPYPLSIRGVREKLNASAELPPLLPPVDSLDPLGIRRARSNRDYTVGVVERLTALAVDTSLSQPLRLALYFFHNATQSLDRLDTLMYDAMRRADVMDRVRANWANPTRKGQGVETLTQLLESEKQAVQQVGIALAVHDKGVR
ncbi:MAG: hypothetical protein HZB43_03600 [candidate division Zixibacteria bacterium]|nr:hypothetical protein [candidate division Zixibacteria bacterium]